MRVFLDTNVLASAVGTRGLCTDLLRHVLAEHDLIVGEVVLDELKRVLRDKFRLPPDRITEVEDLLRAYEVVARPKAPEQVVIQDSSDAWILASARAGNADVLVTGDAEILALTAPLPFRILSPRDFWKELRAR